MQETLCQKQAEKIQETGRRSQAYVSVTKT